MLFKLQQKEGSWCYCCFLPGTGVFGQAEGGPGASHEEYNCPEQERDLRQGTRVPEQKAAAHERWVAKAVMMGLSNAGPSHTADAVTESQAGRMGFG